MDQKQQEAIRLAEEGLSLLRETHEGGGMAAIKYQYWFQDQQRVERSQKAVLARILASLPKGTTLCIR